MEIREVSVERASAKRTVGRRSAVKEATYSTSVLVELAATNGANGIGEVPDLVNPEAYPRRPSWKRCLRGISADGTRGLSIDSPGRSPRFWTSGRPGTTASSS